MPVALETQLKQQIKPSSLNQILQVAVRGDQQQRALLLLLLALLAVEGAAGTVCTATQCLAAAAAAAAVRCLLLAAWLQHCCPILHVPQTEGFCGCASRYAVAAHGAVVTLPRPALHATTP
jgi:hypothetical protein